MKGNEGKIGSQSQISALVQRSNDFEAILNESFNRILQPPKIQK